MKRFFVVSLTALTILSCKKEKSEEIVPVPEKKLIRIEVSEPESEIQTTHRVSYNSEGEIDSVKTVATHDGQDSNMFLYLTYENGLVKTIVKSGEIIAVTSSSGGVSRISDIFEEKIFNYNGSQIVGCEVRSNTNGSTELRAYNLTFHYDQNNKLDNYTQNDETYYAERIIGDSESIISWLKFSDSKTNQRIGHSFTFSEIDNSFSNSRFSGNHGSGKNGKYLSLKNPMPVELSDYLYLNALSGLEHIFYEEIDPDALLLEVSDNSSYHRNYEYITDEKGNIYKIIEKGTISRYVTDGLLREFNFFYE